VLLHDSDNHKMNEAYVKLQSQNNTIQISISRLYWEDLSKTRSRDKTRQLKLEKSCAALNRPQCDSFICI